MLALCMAKDKAPVVGGIGGSLLAMFQEPMLLSATPLLGKLVEVAAFSLVGGLIGEGVKLFMSWVRKRISKNGGSNGKS